MTSIDEAEAALTVAKLEAELVAAKESGDGKKLQKVKYLLRDARQSHREFRQAQPAGDGEARPAAVTAKTRVKG